jgi:NADPH:quinone reductase-like Zn-dependent oxidoreductase
MMTGVPYLMRVTGFGFRRPKQPVRGLALSGVVIAGMSRQTRAPFLSLFTGQRLRVFIARENAADYQELGQLAESGAIRPVIDRSDALADAADAIRQIAAGHATGKGIITI